MEQVKTAVLEASKAKSGKPPAVASWDLVRKLVYWGDPRSPKATPEALEAFRDVQDPSTIGGPFEFLECLGRVKARFALAFGFNFHRFLDGADIVQGLMNIREHFKQIGGTLVLLGVFTKLPPELTNDIIVLDAPLPGDDQIKKIVGDLYEIAEFPAPSTEILDNASDALRGLSEFAVEQVTALSMNAEMSGVDLDLLWQRKQAVVNQTKGLSIARGGDKLDRLGGLAAIKEFSSKFFNGNEPPHAIIRIDEIEKSIAGAAGPIGDSSGVSQDFLNTILQWMEDKEYAGLIAVGPPGSGKSAFSKAVGATYGIPTLAMDLGGMKGSLVGESETNIREALKVIDAVSGCKGLVVATCNKLDILPPELRRRFTNGIWFFDLPDAEERETIWQINLERYGLDSAQARPEDHDWTGAEIRNACKLAWRFREPLTSVAQFIVPVAKADSAGLEALRKAADGRWLSASYAGSYSLGKKQSTAPPTSIPPMGTGRTFNFNA
jgi:hypothetical protein